MEVIFGAAIAIGGLVWAKLKYKEKQATFEGTLL